MLNELYPIIILNKEKYIIDTSRILTSIPPKYRIIQIRTRDIDYIFVDELDKYEIIGYSDTL